MDPYDWLNNISSCYMANVVGIVNGRDLGIDIYHGKLETNPIRVH